MLDTIIDALIDTLKLIPYLFITFIILELLEHKLSKKNEKILIKNKENTVEKEHRPKLTKETEILGKIKRKNTKRV